MKLTKLTPLIFVKNRITWFRSTRRRNKVFIFIGLVILLFYIVNLLINANAKPPYTTVKAKKSNIVQIVSETGNINTSGRTDVYSNTTGIIDELYVENDMQVDTNQALFSVRSTATEAEKAQAYAAYQNALSAQTTANQGSAANDATMWTKQQVLLDAKNAKNYKDNHTKNPSTGNDYTELEKQSIEAAVVQAEKDFRSAEQKYKQTGVSTTAASAQVNSTWLAYLATQSSTVHAPTFGTIANLSLSVGDNVSAGSAIAGTGVQASTALGSTSLPVLTIANLVNNYSIKVAINEVDIPKVSPGQNAVVTIDAFTDKKFEGRVTQVDSVGTNNAGVITYNVNIALLNPIPQVRPGMTAGVDIEVDKAENVLSVPNSSVKPYRGERAVRIIDKKTKQLTFVPVVIGLKGEDRTQIIKGIAEGQEVVSSVSNEQIKRPGLFGN